MPCAEVLQQTPTEYIYKNNELINHLLTTNQAVGRSNSSGRAIQNKGLVLLCQVFLRPQKAFATRKLLKHSQRCTGIEIQLVVDARKVTSRQKNTQLVQGWVN